MTREQRWQAKYEALRRFHATHGHARVPHHYVGDPLCPGLAAWVSNQRAGFKAEAMIAAGQPPSGGFRITKEHAEKLNALGFEWAPGRMHVGLKWARRFEELKVRGEARDERRLAGWLARPRLCFLF